MKIALLIIGRLDSFVNDYDSLKEVVLDKLSPDIFFSGHPNKMGMDYCDQKLENSGILRSIFLEYTEEVRKEVHSNDEKFNARKRPETTPYTWLSGMYNLKKVNELKLKYEKENDFTYDLCLKQVMLYGILQ